MVVCGELLARREGSIVESVEVSSISMDLCGWVLKRHIVADDFVLIFLVYS